MAGCCWGRWTRQTRARRCCAASGQSSRPRRSVCRCCTGEGSESTSERSRGPDGSRKTNAPDLKEEKCNTIIQESLKRGTSKKSNTNRWLNVKLHDGVVHMMSQRKKKTGNKIAITMSTYRTKSKVYLPTQKPCGRRWRCATPPTCTCWHPNPQSPKMR